MKLLVLTLLLLLCSTQVLALKCFTCADDNDDICKETVTCAADETYCWTSTKDDKLERGCKKECTEDQDTECCRTSLCLNEDED